MQKTQIVARRKSLLAQRPSADRSAALERLSVECDLAGGHYPTWTTITNGPKDCHFCGARVGGITEQELAHNLTVTR
jgi:hypothetical protein